MCRCKKQQPTTTPNDKQHDAIDKTHNEEQVETTPTRNKQSTTAGGAGGGRRVAEGESDGVSGSG
jgi:hypothetical protein